MPVSAPYRRLLGRLACAAMVLCSPLVHAHAHLKSQQPAADSTVTAPAQLQLKFSEGVEPAFSQVEVKRADGSFVSLHGIATAATDNKTLIVTPAVAFTPGVYTVNWKIVSVDTHKSSGSYRFSVGE